MGTHTIERTKISTEAGRPIWPVFDGLLSTEEYDWMAIALLEMDEETRSLMVQVMENKHQGLVLQALAKAIRNE